MTCEWSFDCHTDEQHRVEVNYLTEHYDMRGNLTKNHWKETWYVCNECVDDLIEYVEEDNNMVSYTIRTFM